MVYVFHTSEPSLMRRATTLPRKVQQGYSGLVVRPSSQEATGTNTVMTSSCGRLFDAVAALIGLRYEVNFEGQAAIELEAIADGSCEERYEFEISGEDVDFRPMMERIVKETAAPAVVAARFHNTLAEAIHEMCLRMRQESGLNRVCLSGGTFQNVYLLTRAVAGLRRHGFEVFLHSEVPPNDGGLSLGQAVIGSRLCRN